MAVTSHVYPKAIIAIDDGTIDLHSATAGAFKMGLCTGDASAWGATQQAYQYVSDVTGAYTEVASAGYARVSLTTMAVAVGSAANITKWTCASPISFGASITLTARSAFVYTTLAGAADASFPVICIIDFGQNVSSTSGNWTYTVDATNGLAYWTDS